jgi:hypothetical protein
VFSLEGREWTYPERFRRRRGPGRFAVPDDSPHVKCRVCIPRPSSIALGLPFLTQKSQHRLHTVSRSKMTMHWVTAGSSRVKFVPLTDPIIQSRLPAVDERGRFQTKERNEDKNAGLLIRNRSRRTRALALGGTFLASCCCAQEEGTGLCCVLARVVATIWRLMLRY